MSETQYIPAPASEINRRIEKLQACLVAEQMDGALILQKTDLFYFAGTIQDAHLYIPAAGKPVLMVRKSLERAQAESPLEQIVPLVRLRQLPAILVESGIGLPHILGMEFDVVPVNLYFQYKKLFGSAEINDISRHIRSVRAVKSAFELEILRRCGQMADRMMETVSGFLREGVPEIELAGQIEAEARKMGHQGITRMRIWGNEMFFGHLMAGPSAAMPSYLSSPNGGPGTSPAVAQGPGFRPVGREEPVIVDYVFALAGYLTDITRVFSVGSLPDDLVQGYTAMTEIQNALRQAAKPGVCAGDLYEMAVEMAASLGYADNFMGADKERVRFVGHGIGLEVDEYPFLAKGQTIVLEEGMVVALEPKLIFPGKGMVGVENTHVVTPDGLEPLTCFTQEIICV